MAAILPQIRHIVVVMLENRSFDNVCGWLYQDAPQPPSQYLPASSAGKPYDGLHDGLFNPAGAGYFSTGSGETYPVARRANATNMPDPDPEEDFPNVNYQLFGPEAPSRDPKWPNLGFAINYARVTGANLPLEIMQPFSPDQLPVLSALARNFAICDAWFSSVPSDTWPNRSFFHAGTSNGNVVNGEHPNPWAWNVRTIFNVLEDMGISWRVYSDTELIPSLTLAMSPQLWQFSMTRFAHFDDFQRDCAAGSLPRYSFLEPSFVDNPNDEHPPHDVIAGEQFLYQIWQAVSQSPAWAQTLLLITYDEHGGTYDHVMPPWGAMPPGPAPDGSGGGPGEQGFGFDRFGVRVPMIAVSPWIQAGTVFRSVSPAVPFDHTSVAATLRGWLEIPADKMLTSRRIAAAPNLAHVLTLNQPRTKLPEIPGPRGEVKATAAFLPPNALQRSLVSARAVERGHDPVAVLGAVRTREDASRYLKTGLTPAGSGGTGATPERE